MEAGVWSTTAASPTDQFQFTAPPVSRVNAALPRPHLSIAAEPQRCAPSLGAAEHISPAPRHSLNSFYQQGKIMRILTPENKYESRILKLSTGEFVTEKQIVDTLLPSGSFANRKSVEAEVENLFTLIAAIVDFAVRKKQSEKLAQAA
jgi:hypothetical protein